VKYLKTYNESLIYDNGTVHHIYKDDEELLYRCEYLINKYGKPNEYLNSRTDVKVNVSGSDFIDKPTNIDRRTIVDPDDDLSLYIIKYDEEISTSYRIFLQSVNDTNYYIESCSTEFEEKIIEYIHSENIESKFESTKLGLL